MTFDEEDDFPAIGNHSYKSIFSFDSLPKKKQKTTGKS